MLPPPKNDSTQMTQCLGSRKNILFLSRNWFQHSDQQQKPFLSHDWNVRPKSVDLSHRSLLCTESLNLPTAKFCVTRVPVGQLYMYAESTGLKVSLTCTHLKLSLICTNLNINSPAQTKLHRSINEFQPVII